MECAARKIVTGTKIWASVLAVLSIGCMGPISSAYADEANAKRLFKAMSDYLASQKVIFIDYDSNLEIVTSQKQKLGLTSSGTVVLSRPDKIHATRTGGFANVELVFDGNTLTLLGKNANAYTQVEAPGTIDQLVDDLRVPDKRGGLADLDCPGRPAISLPLRDYQSRDCRDAPIYDRCQGMENASGGRGRRVPADGWRRRQEDRGKRSP